MHRDDPRWQLAQYAATIAAVEDGKLSSAFISDAWEALTDEERGAVQDSWARITGQKEWPTNFS